MIAACGGNATAAPDPALDQDKVRATNLEEASSQSSNPPTPSSQASPTSSVATASATLTGVLPGAFFPPTPTPNPSNSPWVRERLSAIAQIYGLTDEGIALLESLDLRQMRGEPGFFGSFGFKSWAGVGEAKPQGVMHEIGHSYWGAFPITGIPDLTWDTPPGEERSPAMESYHADILTFMAQPPDRFELFRQRLRNLPELSQNNTEPLFHNLEAGMVYSTGGSLSLVPPILRKYWDRFLNDGQFDSWYQAVSWFSSLSDDKGSINNRFRANNFLGFEHLDLRDYDSLTTRQDDVSGISVPAEVLITEALITEERQRLFDLADQFDLLLGDSQQEEQFQFWRGYLRDKVELHELHPSYLSSLDLPRASSLALALDFLISLKGLQPEQQAEKVIVRLADEPFLVNFLPVLENRALLLIFASETSLPQGETLQATASFVDRLELFGGLVAGVMDAGRANPQQGADELNRFLEDTDFELVQDLRLFFDLFRGEDPDTARHVVQELRKETVRRLMKPVPAQLRFTLSADDLLEKLDITGESRVSDIKRGLSLLLEEPSGNFIIDEPFLTAMYQVIAVRSGDNPSETLTVLRDTLFPLEGFILNQPLAAATLLNSDIDAAVELLRQSDPVVSPPARNVYRMVQEDAKFAARLVGALNDIEEMDLVVESIAYLAYDKARQERVPSLPISLEQDGKYLADLADQLGEDVLTERLSEAFSLYRQRASSGQVAEDFLVEFRATLDAAAATISVSTARDDLTRIISAAAGD